MIRKHENTLYFQKKGIDVVLGEAKFSGKDRIVVNNKEYSAKKIILATGSSPRKLKIPEIEKVDYLTNENIFELNILPKNFLIIGGGPIGIEIGQAFSRLGSKVTIIQNSNQFLPKEDIEISNILCKQLKAEGVNLLFETKTLEFNSPHTLIIERKGKNETVFFDKVLISIGRELNIQGLNLEKAGIEIDSDGRKLKVNDYLQTTNKNVYVCGD
ncbi:mercuric reductase, partial [Candidatus Uhrbacteria bacterium CG10_big_fil_rev_8_21_14_0_10_50_16]